MPPTPAAAASSEDEARERNSWQTVMLGGLTEGYQVLGRLGPGEHFGEYSCLMGECRTATVVAMGQVELYSLSRESLEQVGPESTAGAGSALLSCARLCSRKAAQPHLAPICIAAWWLCALLPTH